MSRRPLKGIHCLYADHLYLQHLARRSFAEQVKNILTPVHLSRSKSTIKAKTLLKGSYMLVEHEKEMRELIMFLK